MFHPLFLNNSYDDGECWLISFHCIPFHFVLYGSNCNCFYDFSEAKIFKYFVVNIIMILFVHCICVRYKSISEYVFKNVSYLKQICFYHRKLVS